MASTGFLKRGSRRPGFLRAETPPEPPSFSAFLPDPTIVDTEANSIVCPSSNDITTAPTTPIRGRSPGRPVLLEPQSTTKRRKTDIGFPVRDNDTGAPRRKTSRTMAKHVHDSSIEPSGAGGEGITPAIIVESTIQPPADSSGIRCPLEISTSLVGGGQREGDTCSGENSAPLDNEDRGGRSYQYEDILQISTGVVNQYGGTYVRGSKSTPVRRSLRIMAVRGQNNKVSIMQGETSCLRETTTPTKCPASNAVGDSTPRQRGRTPSKIPISTPKLRSTKENKPQTPVRPLPSSEAERDKDRSMSALAKSHLSTTKGGGQSRDSHEQAKGEVLKEGNKPRGQHLPGTRSKSRPRSGTKASSAATTKRRTSCGRGGTPRKCSVTTDTVQPVERVENTDSVVQTSKPIAHASSNKNQGSEDKARSLSEVDVGVTSIDKRAGQASLSRKGNGLEMHTHETRAGQKDKMVLPDNICIGSQKEPQLLAGRTKAASTFTVYDDLPSGSMENPSYGRFIENMRERTFTKKPSNVDCHSTQLAIGSVVDDCGFARKSPPNNVIRVNKVEGPGGADLEVAQQGCRPAVVTEVPRGWRHNQPREQKKRKRPIDSKKEMRTCSTQVTPVSKKISCKTVKPDVRDIQTSTTDFSRVMYVPEYRSLCLQVDLDQTNSVPKRRRVSSERLSPITNSNCGDQRKSKVDTGTSCCGAAADEKASENQAPNKSATSAIVLPPAPPPEHPREYRSACVQVDMSKSSLNSHLFMNTARHAVTCQRVLATPELARSATEVNPCATATAEHLRVGKKSLSMLIAEEQNILNSRRESSQGAFVVEETIPPMAVPNADAFPRMITDIPPVATEINEHLHVPADLAPATSPMPIAKIAETGQHVSTDKQRAVTNSPRQISPHLVGNPIVVEQAPLAVNSSNVDCPRPRRKVPSRPRQISQVRRLPNAYGTMPMSTVRTSTNSLQKDLLQRPYIRRRVVISNEVFRRVNRKAEQLWEAFHEQFQRASWTDKKAEWAARKAAARRSEGRRDALVEHNSIDESMEEEIESRVANELAQVQKKLDRMKRDLTTKPAARSSSDNDRQRLNTEKRSPSTADENGHRGRLLEDKSGKCPTTRHRVRSGSSKSGKTSRTTTLSDRTNNRENKQSRITEPRTMMTEEISPIKQVRFVGGK